MNDGDHALTFLYLLGCLVLVGSALAARRIPIGQGLKMAAGWVLIFLAVFAAFALRDDFSALGRRLFADGRGQPIVEGKTVRIRRESDGHYWVNASVNDVSVRFLIDSGATVTMVSKAMTDTAGISAQGGFPLPVDTANGTIFVRRGVVRELALGPIQRHDFPIHIGQGDTDLNVLGMDFLSSLASWGTEDGWLVLKA